MSPPHFIIGHYWNFHIRAATFLWPFAFIAALPPGAFAPSRRIAMVLLLLIAAPTALAQLAWRGSITKWDAVATGFEEVLHAAPDGSHLVFVAKGQPATGFRSGLWRHLAQYHTVFNAGVTPFSFAYHPGRIVSERAPHLGRQFIAPRELPATLSVGCVHAVLQMGTSRLDERHRNLRLEHRIEGWSLYTHLDDRHCATHEPPGRRVPASR